MTKKSRVAAYESDEEDPDSQPRASRFKADVSIARKRRKTANTDLDTAEVWGPLDDEEEVEQEDFNMDDADVLEDDDFIVDEPKKRQKKSDTKGKKARMSKKPTAKGVKKDRDSPILIKDERKGPQVSKGEGSSRPKHLKLDDLVLDAVSSAAGTPEIETPVSETASQKEAIPLLQNKRKLPTIKKHAGKGSTTNPAASKLAPKPEAVPPTVNSGASANRPSHALAGHADFDLRDKSVYLSLFKSVSALSCSDRSRRSASCIPRVREGNHDLASIETRINNMN